jgi:hypothetical protein
MVRWRRTDSNQWQEVMPALDPSCAVNKSGVCTSWVILRHIRVDDWVFGVSSVSKDGFESPIASAVPGGAFKPFVAPAKKP